MRRALAIMIVLAGCDDASELEPSADASPAVLDAAAAIADGGLDASWLDAGYVEEVAELVDAGRDPRDAAALPYARDVVSFQPGTNAGYGSNKFPGVVLGPPSGKGNSVGSLEVLSLGVGGEIVLDFGERAIVDGPGADFIVFENAFWPGGVRASVFAELGEVSVSDDLTSWQTFPCSRTPKEPGVYPGCAGWTPTLAYDPFALVPLDPTRSGGDAFDLASVSRARARYVRVRDLASSGEGTTAGFDLDAIGIIHAD